MNNTFLTDTDFQYVRLQSGKSFILFFGIFSLAACLGFLVAWQTFLFLEFLVVISCVYGFWQNGKQEHRWKLEFENDFLTITNLKTQESFCVYDIPASDFVITQTKREIPLDYCTVAIKHTVFAFGGVRNCRALKAYIQDHYA